MLGEAYHFQKEVMWKSLTLQYVIIIQIFKIMFKIIYPKRELMAVVIATSHINPIDILSQIEAGLNSQRFQGDIYIDLLLVNGNTHDRFILTHSSDNKINRSIMSSRSQSRIPSIVHDGIIGFHQEFPEYLETSQVLSEDEKSQILSSKVN
jgi:Antitoxin to bacterial toxin RNase LS or RnlA